MCTMLHVILMYYWHFETGTRLTRSLHVNFGKFVTSSLEVFLIVRTGIGRGLF